MPRATKKSSKQKGGADDVPVAPQAQATAPVVVDPIQQQLQMLSERISKIESFLTTPEPAVPAAPVGASVASGGSVKRRAPKRK